MADISKINAVLLANIAEIDDVLAANIAKVNGLVFSTAPAFTGLLDTYTGAAAAFSTRRLYGQYTGAAMRVRRDSDDTEQDIGFDSNGDLDTAAIATFVGSGNNGYVTKWYGQESSGGTGSGNDAAQTTSGTQPQIYDGSAVITENGKPAVSFLGTRYLVTPFDTSSTDFDLPQTMYLAARIVSPGSYNNYSFIICGGNVAFSLGKFAMTAQQGVGTTTQYRTTSAISDSVTNYTDTAMYLHGGYYGSSLLKTSYNGAALTSGTSITEGDYTNTALAIGGTGTTSDGTFNVSEYLLWHSDQSTNKSGIEGNVNTHFQIGNFGTPTSGLLYDYSGAAAAYSVRQLANTAALAMRIREDGTDTETDIGFDSNGDLDTAAISSHCGANNGYVVTWYDQSGNSNNATQSTTANQPQIYNGTAVITQNGKPAVYTPGSKNLNTGTYAIGTSGDISLDFFAVMTNNSGGSSAETGALFMLGDESSTTDRRRVICYVNDSSTQKSVRLYGGFTKVDSTISGQTLFNTNYQGGGGAFEIRFNGSTATADSHSNTGLNVQAQSGFSLLHGDSNTKQSITATSSQAIGYLQEAVFYLSDQSSNRSGIETNINNYFSIY